MSRIASLVAVLLLASAAALAQIPSEVPLTQPVTGPAPGDQSSPVVATNGTDFLVAWLDGRGPVYSIYANRVQRDGQILDGTGIRLPIGDPQTANVRLLGVFPMAGAYVVVFNEQRFLGNDSTYETWAARIGAGGEVLEPPHLVLSGPFLRVAASNGARIVLAGDTLATLDDRGNLVERDLPGLAPGYGVGIASNGSTFLVVSYSYRVQTNFVTFTALDERGHLTAAADTVAPGSGDGPLIGSDGTDYLVLYNDARVSGTIAQVVTPAAALGAMTTLPPFGTSTFTGSLLWTGSKYLLVSTSEDQLQQVVAATLSRSGALLDGPHPLGIAGTPGATNAVKAAWNGAKAFVVAATGSQQDVNSWDINGAFASADAKPLSTAQTISTSANLQVSPAIATGGVNDLVAWFEPAGIFAARVTPAGAVLDPHGILVASHGFESRSLVYGAPFLLRAVFDGSAYVVAWSDSIRLQLRRIDPATGALLGDTTTLFDNCIASFAFARGNGNVFLLVSSCRGVVMQLLGPMGALFPEVSLPLPSDMNVGPVAAAWNGSEWLIVLQQRIPLSILVSPPLYRGNLYAMRLSGALVPLDAQPIPIAVSDQNEFGPLVASNGSDFLIAWTHIYDNPGMRARVVHADGRTEQPVVLSNDGSEARDLVFDGARYALALAALNPANHTYWLWLTHFGLDDRIPISVTPAGQQSVTLAAPPGRPLRAAYDRVRLEPEFGGVSRVFVKDVTGGGRRRSAR